MDVSTTDQLADAAKLQAYLVEDSPVIRESLIQALEEMTPVAVVGAAEDEATALAWLAANPQRCDLVIIDIFLKAGSGLGVLAGARELGSEQTRVVLSNYATPDMRQQCEQLGADRVFDKSNEIDSLIDYCNALAAR